MTDGEPVPFVVAVADQVLDDLRERLRRTRWPDEAPAAGWAHGTSLAYLRELAAYWADGYDWRRAERALNELAQYVVDIDDVGLHFAHVRGKGHDPLPLLLVHGWPGSVWEFARVVPLLTDPARFGGDAGDAFDVVVPSLPGYGFSFRPGQRRLGIAAMADVLAVLMRGVLGYRRFGVQGGDWGSFVAARLAADHGRDVLGIHLNYLPMRVDPAAIDVESADGARYVEALRALADGTAYSAIQGTRPQTLAYALTDSPIGLAAWLVEKFRSWSDCKGNVESVFSKDDLLTAVMVYWVTGAIGSSFWPYYDRLHDGGWPLPEGRLAVPAAYAEFPHEVIVPPRRLAERTFDLQRWTTMQAGGHFAAFEQPEALAADVRAFFRPLRAHQDSTFDRTID